MKFVQFLICLCLFNMADPTFAKEQTACEVWLDSVKDYGNKMEAVIPGESEDLLSKVNETLQAKIAGDVEKAAHSRKIFHEKVVALKRINPPSELKNYHSKLTIYCTEVEKAIDAVLEHGYWFVEKQRCLQALLRLYEEIESLLVEHRCENGDLKEVKEKRIPQLKEILRTEFPQ